MSNVINTNMQTLTGAPATRSAASKSENPTPEQLSSGYAVKAPQVRQLDPLVPPPSMQDFELQSPPVFPGMSELPNPKVEPPAGIDKLLDTPAIVRAKGSPSPASTATGVAVTINRASSVMEAVAASGAMPTGTGSNLREPEEASEAAAITRDQIRYEPKAAITAQANSTPANVLALLK